MAVINTNLSGVFYVSQAVGRGMLQRGYGRILSIGSVSSLLGHPENAPYAAAKGGIAIMTKSLRHRMGSRRRHRQRHRPRLHPDRADQTHLGRSRKSSDNSPPYSHGPFRTTGGPCRRSRLPLLRIAPASSPARPSTSTAAAPRTSPVVPTRVEGPLVLDSSADADGRQATSRPDRSPMELFRQLALEGCTTQSEAR